MKKVLLFYIIVAFSFSANSQTKDSLFHDKTPFEKGNGNQTATYKEMISYYRQLDDHYDEIKMLEYGKTDVGKPLHLIVISKNKVFDPAELQRQNKGILLINNAIHPGEPEGVDASMMLTRDLLNEPELYKTFDNVVILIIPAYNIGGMLNRNSTTRVNQNGPESYGFRGNARNLDLNRDFIKNDSRNAREFAKIYHEWDPDVFIDNHTTNGADYQHVVTHIFTHRQKLQPDLAEYFYSEMLPDLNDSMKSAGFPLSPYVVTMGETPDSGLISFPETPRYSTGYVSLFNTMGFVVETHMFKPFGERVWGTYNFSRSVIQIMNNDYMKFGHMRHRAKMETKEQDEFVLHWKLDKTKTEEVDFMGYEHGYKKSEITGQNRLYYDRSQPWEKKIPYFTAFEPEVTVKKPHAYVVPQAWRYVIELLKLNGVEMKKLTRDVELEGEAYYIEEHKTSERPYEGHYLHSNTKVRKEKQNIQFYKGDYVIFPDQDKNNYIIQTLEPEGPDSYFSWNYFDEILMQKEYFSSYIFEKRAEEILATNPEIKKELEAKQSKDPEFRKNHRAQLDFIYKRSPHYEKSHKRYPVMRLLKEQMLPLEQ